MKYIRTKDGIFKVYENSSDDKCFQECYAGQFVVPSKRIVDKEEIIASAPNIDMLLDFFVVIGKDNVPHLLSRNAWDAQKVFEFFGNTSKCIYGAIWTEGLHGEPILKSVAKINEKREFELL